MDFYSLTLGDTITICGTIAFAISGALAAMQKRLDPFGVFIISFVTAVGGGTVRDLLIGDFPVFWIEEGRYSVIILIGSLLSMF
ncbi:trimeric intracellular cation channel family protein, partial [Pseudoxanthomonas sp. SGD-10]